MIESDTKARIYRYYRKPESRLGYTFVSWDAKHFAYYRDPMVNIGEKNAQIAYHKKIAECLSLQGGERILDAGCGRGVVACYLAKTYPVEVVGIDIVDFEIESARKRALAHGVPASFVVMDYSEVGFPGGSFDALYANETLSHAPDLKKVFSEFFRVLKPGSRFAFFEYVLGDDGQLSDSSLRNLDWIIEHSGMFGLKQFRQGNIEVLLSETGFDDIKVENITEHIKPSFERFNRLARSLYPFIKLLHLKNQFVNVVSAVELYPMAKQGFISFYIYTGKK